MSSLSGGQVGGCGSGEGLTWRMQDGGRDIYIGWSGPDLGQMYDRKSMFDNLSMLVKLRSFNRRIGLIR